MLFIARHSGPLFLSVNLKHTSIIVKLLQIYTYITAWDLDDISFGTQLSLRPTR